MNNRWIKHLLLSSALVSGLILTGCGQNHEPQKQTTASQTQTTAQSAQASTIPSRPEALKFAAQEIVVPNKADYRHALDNGNVLYVVEDHSLPLVTVKIASRLGEQAIADEDIAVAMALARMLREGGTSTMTPEQVDERLEFLATNLRFGIDNTSAEASVDSLSKNLDESLDILFALLTDNQFNAERFAVVKKSLLERIKTRNDDTRTIEPRVWNRIIYGDKFFTNRMATADQIEQLTVDDLRRYAKKLFANGQLVIAVSGDVKAEEMVSVFNKRLAALPKGEPVPVPTDYEAMPPGLYGVNKDGVTQSRVSVGHPAVKRGHPDEMAIRVMNEILGGGGFTSRITSRVRSDEGLAYSAGSYFSFPSFYDGMFRAYYQSKNQTVAYALKIVLEEINRIRTQPVTEKELSTAKESVKAAISDMFRNADATASRFLWDEVLNNPEDLWAKWSERTDAVTVERVQDVAQKYLQPEALRILVVGDLKAVLPGDGEHGTLEEVAGHKLTQLPLRDPLTLKPLPLADL